MGLYVEKFKVVDLSKDDSVEVVKESGFLSKWDFVDQCVSNYKWRVVTKNYETKQN